MSRIDTIINAVCQEFEILPNDLFRGPKTRVNARARQAAAWLLRILLGLSYPQIARALQYGNHTTAMAAVTVAQNNIRRRTNFAARIYSLQDRLAPIVLNQSAIAPEAQPDSPIAPDELASFLRREILARTIARNALTLRDEILSPDCQSLDRDIACLTALQQRLA